MRTENEEIRDHLKYLSLLARDYPSQAAAASEIISTQDCWIKGYNCNYMLCSHFYTFLSFQQQHHTLLSLLVLNIEHQQQRFLYHF